MRRATPADRDLLVRLMTEFYAEAGYQLDPRLAASAFDQLLSTDALGSVTIVEADGEPAGYVVLTLGFSMEYAGRDAFVDDLFIREPFRGQGLGARLLAHARQECLDLGVRALHLEVGRDNDPAKALYFKAGFINADRMLLTLRLAPPSHVV
jgi:GNAT superfamily N-acetyltransferase